jgi:hypothetical protein
MDSATEPAHGGRHAKDDEMSLMMLRQKVFDSAGG